MKSKCASRNFLNDATRMRYLMRCSETSWLNALQYTFSDRPDIEGTAEGLINVYSDEGLQACVNSLRSLLFHIIPSEQVRHAHLLGEIAVVKNNEHIENCQHQLARSA